MENITRTAKIAVKNFAVFVSYAEGPKVSSVFSVGKDAEQFKRLSEFMGTEELNKGVFKFAHKYVGSADSSVTQPGKPNSILIPKELMPDLLSNKFQDKVGDAIDGIIEGERDKPWKVDAPRPYGGFLRDEYDPPRRLIYCVTPNNWHRVSKEMTNTHRSKCEIRCQLSAFDIYSKLNPDLVDRVPTFLMTLTESEFNEVFLNPRVKNWLQSVSKDPGSVENVNFEEDGNKKSKRILAADLDPEQRNKVKSKRIEFDREEGESRKKKKFGSSLDYEE